MPATEDRVFLTVSVPKSIVDRINQAAEHSSRTVDDEVAWLVESGLESEMTWEEQLEKVRNAYRERYESTGRPVPTTEELWEQMRRIREEVANELYPD